MVADLQTGISPGKRARHRDSLPETPPVIQVQPTKLTTGNVLVGAPPYAQATELIAGEWLHENTVLQIVLSRFLYVFGGP
jgi:hypothetical protein